MYQKNPLFLIEENVKRKLFKQAEIFVKKSGLNPTRVGDPDKIALLLYKKDPKLATAYFSHVKRAIGNNGKIVSLKTDWGNNKPAYKTLSDFYKELIQKQGKRNRTAYIDDIINARSKHDKDLVRFYHDKADLATPISQRLKGKRDLHTPKNGNFDPTSFYDSLPKTKFNVERPRRRIW